jgi:hypothetical protein
MKLNCKTWFAAAGLAGLLGAGAIILGADSKAVLLDSVRAARLDGDCPAQETADAAKCDGGMVQGKGFCICLTKEETLDSEVAVGEIDQSKKVSMHVCERLKGSTTVREVLYLPAAAVSPVGCLPVVENVKLPGITMNHIPTGIEDQLFEACYPTAWSQGKPNIITPGSWSHCPYCKLPTTPPCVYPKEDE